MTLGTDGCMKCEVMTGGVLGSWAGHSWSTGQDDGQVAMETETHASYLGWGELISGLTSSSHHLKLQYFAFIELQHNKCKAQGFIRQNIS